ncbi:MAG: T9SS type A sorting domain-containing protein [Fulvivirga sp.]
MRKLIALCSVLFIVLFAFDTYAITIPPQFNDEITGPSTVCTGTVGNYTLVMENCFVSILDIQTTSNGILTTLPSFPTDLNQFSVQWFNNGSTITTGRIDVVVWFYPGQCPNPAGPIPPASTKTVSLTVTIEPGNPVVTAPGAISSSLVYNEILFGQQADSYYLFSTSAADVDGSQWDVNGGTIIRNDGQSIRVRSDPGSCQLGASVRSFRQNCSGGNSFSAWRNTSYNILLPSNPDPIDGSENIFSGGTGTYTVNDVFNAEYYDWRIEGSPYLTLNDNPVAITGTVATVSSAVPSGSIGISTLYVSAKNSCGQSLNESSFRITSYALIGLSNSSKQESKDLKISPNPVHSGQNFLLHRLAQGNDQVVSIKNENGDLVYSYNLSGEQSQMLIDGLKSGLYFVEFKSNKDAKIERLMVLD